MTDEEKREEAARDDMIMNAFADGGDVVYLGEGPEDTSETADFRVLKDGRWVDQRPKQTMRKNVARRVRVVNWCIVGTVALAIWYFWF